MILLMPLRYVVVVFLLFVRYIKIIVDVECFLVLVTLLLFEK